MIFREENINGQKIIRRFLSIIMLACIIAIVGQSTCFSSTVVLQWEKSDGAAGYKVYYRADSPAQPFQGTDADQGASPIIVQNQTTATISTSISGLDPARSYYFAVAAYSISGVESSYSNIVAIHPLSVNFSGNGSGSVNSNPSGISCVSGICVSQFGTGSSIILNATPSESPSSLSYFSGWTGAYSSVSGSSCTVDINAAKNITANFTTLKPVHIAGGTYYSDSLQSAFGAAVNNSNIQAQAVTLTGNFTANSNYTITLKGGHNANYSSVSGKTIIAGTLTLARGTLIADNLVIK
jgi:hypothetical protein